MRTRKLLLGWLVVAVLVVLIGGLAVFLVRVPEVAQQVPPGVSSIAVILSTPSSDALVPMDQFTTVSAEAVDVKPIASLELWIDGTPAGTQNAPSGSNLNRFSAFWTWTPATEGEHTLLVRAIGANHKIGMSNIVRVTASGEANASPSVAIQTKPGDTVASIAQDAKADPQQIVDLNPQVDPNNPITEGDTVTVPIVVPPAPSPTAEAVPPATPEPQGDPNQPPANGNPNKYVVWWNQNILKQFFAVKLPAAPGLSAGTGAGKCSINLYISDQSDNEDGFFIYKLAPNAGGFERIATLDAHSGTHQIHYVDPTGTGKYQYYVSSFNAMGETASKIVGAAIIEPCAAPQQQSLGFSKAIVTVSQPVDKIYCYLRVDNGLWTRVPPGPNTFITPSKPGQFDLSAYLKSLTPPPPPPQITLRLQCWGWNGGTLTYLGEASETIKPGHVQVKSPFWQLVGNFSPVTHVLDGPGVPQIGPPRNLKLTADPQECSMYMPGVPCSGYAAVGWVFLYWEWWIDKGDFSPSPPCSSGDLSCIPDIDGFHIYILEPNDPTPHLFTTVPAAISLRSGMAFTFWPRDPQVPDQIFVRAYKGPLESADSVYVPLAMKTATVTVDIPAQARFVWNKQEENCEGIAGSGGGGAPWYVANTPPGPVVVGYEHNDQNCDFWNAVYQGAFWFDTSKIPAGQILNVQLKYAWKDSMFLIGGDTATPNVGITCASNLMLAKTDVRAAQTLYADPYLSLVWGETFAPSNPRIYSFDVTSAVKEWVEGLRPNYGFVLVGPNPFLDGDYGTNICSTVYGDFVLEVQVQVWQ